jgi:ribose transport system substrate-binding protein
VFYDNRRDGARAAANAREAVARKVDLYIEYLHDATANAMVGEVLRQARIPGLAVNAAVPGAPLYTVDNLGAGRIAGEALGQFGAATWRAQPTLAVLIGALTALADGIPERAQGVRDGLRRHLPRVQVAALDTQGNPSRVGPLLGGLLAAHTGTKILVAAMDDTTALLAKSALEAAGRVPDAMIVSHGADHSVHGGMNEKKEIDPHNRGSILLGSVAFFLDRYGEDLLPLALRMLQGEAVPPRTTTQHVLVTAANVFRIYPPIDMN